MTNDSIALNAEFSRRYFASSYILSNIQLRPLKYYVVLKILIAIQNNDIRIFDVFSKVLVYESSYTTHFLIKITMKFVAINAQF